MRTLIISISILSMASAVIAAEPPFANAPPQAAAFAPIIGDHPCEMTYRGPDGALDQTAKCRWNWYYKFEGHMVQDDFWMYDENGKTVWAGSTLRTWDFARNRWNNMFLGAHDQGFGRMFHGLGVEDEIHLTVDGEEPDGRKHINRLIFHDIKDGAFNWRQERSYDNGESWELYVKTEAGPPESEKD